MAIRPRPGSARVSLVLNSTLPVLAFRAPPGALVMVLIDPDALRNDHAGEHDEPADNAIEMQTNVMYDF